MFAALSPSPRRRPGTRRAVALALFALQGLVALSPLAERGLTERPHTHVEERGAIHPFAHDDSSCALCSVRSMHSAVASRTNQIVAAPGREGLRTFLALAAPSPAGGRTNLSRAPPAAA